MSRSNAQQKKAKILLYRIMPVCCENFEKVGAEIRHLGPKKLSYLFHLFALFSLSPAFLCILRCVLCFFLYLLVSVNIMGDVLGSYFSFCTFCVFGRFGCFCAFLGFQWQLGCFESNSELQGNQKDYIGCREGH